MSSDRPAIRMSCDTGEARTDAGRAVEAELATIVDVLNIACGGHAGDNASMRNAVAHAVVSRCEIAAHPSYPDRGGFGRRPMPMSERELSDSVAHQLAALVRICESMGVAVTHIKPHGALYHCASNDPNASQAIDNARRAVIPEAAIVMPCGAPTARWWADRGVRVIAEAFADRRYEPNGSLRDRSFNDALISSPEEAYRQAREIAASSRAVAVGGREIKLRAELLCVHSDGANPVPVARRVRAAIDGQEPR